MNAFGLSDQVALDLEVARFLYVEAALLEDRRWDDWLALWDDDAEYVVPTRSDVADAGVRGRSVAGSHAPRDELQFVDEPTFLLGVRIAKLRSGKAWAEEPPSHTTRLITNVHALGAVDGATEVRSDFLVHRTRAEGRTDRFLGTRRDRLRRTDDGWRIAGRTVYLNAGVLQAPNLELFF